MHRGGKGDERVQDRLHIGLALGSGGTRGFAHIGVLQVLEEAGIEVEAIAGSSMGSLIASVYATGAPIDRMEQLALHLPLKRWVDVTVPKLGLVAGRRFHELIKLLTKNMDFSDTSIPLAVVATDIELGERVIFTSGAIHDAVRASIGIPGIFVPHRIGDRMLVDGGVIERVPIQAVRDLGADFVVAIDVGLFERLPPVKNTWDVIVQTMDIMEREVFRNRILHADFVVRPKLDLMSSISFTGVSQAIDVGRQAMKAALPELLLTLQTKRGVS